MLLYGGRGEGIAVAQMRHGVRVQAQPLPVPRAGPAAHRAQRKESMMAEKFIKCWECDVCGHRWIADPDRTKPEPTRCASRACQSSKWNRLSKSLRRNESVTQPVSERVLEPAEPKRPARTKQCPRCRGARGGYLGECQEWRDCSRCNGTGQVEATLEEESVLKPTKSLDALLASGLVKKGIAAPIVAPPQADNWLNELSGA